MRALQRASRVAAAGGALVLLGWQFDIQSLRALGPVNVVMNPLSALLFVLTGSVLLLPHIQGHSGWRPAHLLILPVALMSLLVVIGYLYNAAGFITFQLQLPIALNTPLFFLAASFALLAARPNEEVMALFVTDSAGGAITRRLLPALLLVPLVLGILINLGVRSGWYGPTAALALLTLARIVLSVLLTLTTTGALHRSDVALRRSEEHFRAPIENASDYVIIIDQAGAMHYVGPSVEWILGYLLGDAPEDLVHPDDLAKVHKANDKVFSNPGEVFRAEFRIRHRDGSWRVFESIARTLHVDAGEARAVVNARDITDRKAVEVALQEAKDEAERANRAKSEFLSRMSHELRTPMNAILGFAQLLERKGLRPDEAKHLAHILKAGKHLLQLIDEVLDISRIEAGRMMLLIEPVSVNEVIREAMDLVRPLTDDSGSELLFAEAVGTEVFASAGRQRLCQILINLLSNAIKYNRPGG